MEESELRNNIYYKDLLIKYMKHVYKIESITYVYNIEQMNYQDLTQQDIEILQKISKDIQGW